MLSSFGRESARAWLYLDLVLIGAGLGLTMLTLLIAVQQAVPRAQLGTVTSFNQFARSIGGAGGGGVIGGGCAGGGRARQRGGGRGGGGRGRRRRGGGT